MLRAPNAGQQILTGHERPALRTRISRTFHSVGVRRTRTFRPWYTRNTACAEQVNGHVPNETIGVSVFCGIRRASARIRASSSSIDTGLVT